MEQWKIDELRSALDNQDRLKIHTIIDNISFLELMELCKNTFVGWIKNKFKITKKHSLFKNDFFGIKHKRFKKKVLNSLIERNHLQADKLACLLDIVTIINIPRDEDEENKLKLVCERYDALLEEVNSEMNRVKKMIGEVLNMESAESLKLKEETKNNLRKDLIASGRFDADTIDKIMEVFDMSTAGYELRKISRVE